MCNDIQKITFTGCGHQVVFFLRKSRFCLFKFDKQDDFHMVNTYPSTLTEKCPRCVVAREVRDKGIKLSRPVLQTVITAKLLETQNGKNEAIGKRIEAAAQEARDNLDATRVKTLNEVAQQAVAAILSKNKATVGAKMTLFHSIVNLPDVFDKKTLVLVFASHRGPFEKRWEQRDAHGLARRAGFLQTLKSGMAMQPIKIAASKPEITKAVTTQPVKVAA